MEMMCKALCNESQTLCPSFDFLSCISLLLGVAYFNKATVNDFECVCEGQTCGSDGRCFGQQCFSSVSIRNGTGLRQKGCIVSVEEEAVQCRSSLLESGVMVQCCQGTLCNSNLTVEMPSSDKATVNDFECVCEGQTCGSDGRCFGQQCFSSVSIRNGTGLRQKGCIVSVEEEAVQCRSSLLESGVMVQCCQGTLCNSNLTVEMPSS
ncbi:activin receptor type-1 isoform X1, partial [Tachysurus ichikawai]